MAFRWLPSYPYPTVRPDEGYWAPVTSTINWCEEDYYATIYIAEIINTLTNVGFIAMGLKGVHNCLKYKHDSVFLVGFIGYTLVGIGSFLYHTTLKYPMQLFDELNMIYTACLMFYATYTYRMSRLFRRILAGGLIFTSGFTTLYYHYLQNPVFHQNVFAFLIIMIIFRWTYTMEYEIRPHLRAKYDPEAEKSSHKGALKVEQTPYPRQDQQIMKSMWTILAVGILSFATGFGIWLLDVGYCSTIRRWRHQVGMPWGLVLEGHGWWHLLTGVGSYYYIVCAIWLRRCLNHEEDDFVLNWPSVLSALPEVVSKSSASGQKSRTNGHGDPSYDKRDLWKSM